MIRGYKEAVAATSASSTVPDMTTMVRTVAVVTSASSSPRAEGEVSIEGAVSAAGDVVASVLAVDQVGTQAVSAVEVSTSVRAATDFGHLCFMEEIFFFSLLPFLSYILPFLLF